MILNCLIVDDEPLVLDLLENYVGRTPFLQLAGRAGSAQEAWRCMERAGRGTRERIDLLFLNIQMPLLNGAELSRLLAEKSAGRTRVIFITVFGKYALEGFRVDALDCLFKPISYREFLRAAMKAHNWFLKTGATMEAEAAEFKRDSIWVRSDYRQVRLRFEDILYIEGVRDSVRVWLADGSQTLTQMSLKAMVELLPKEEFVRVHRSYIVHLTEVKTMKRGRIVFGKVGVPVSDSCRDEFVQRLAQRACAALRPSDSEGVSEEAE